MDAQRIRYATSADGTDIAYALLGSGPPLLLVDAFLSGGLDVRLRSRHSSAFFEALAANRSVIAFDWRNSGLSGPATEFTPEHLVGDVQAVADQVGLDQFELWALQSPGQIAMQFAASNQERLKKIVFSQPRPKGTFARVYAFGMSMVQGAAVDWESFIELYALRNYGWTEAGNEFVDELKKQWTPERLKSFMDSVNELDPFVYVGDITCESLVISRESDGPDNRRAAQRLAAMLPNGHLVITPLEHARDPEQVWAAASFLGDFDERPKVEALTPVVQEDTVRVILFTDIEEHTQMMRRLGDAKGRELLREHERITREALRAHGGTEIKTMGDGFMASFSSAHQALECAIQLQAQFEAFNQRSPTEDLRIRIGINAGEPIADGADLFGSSVILAQRTAAQAKAGEVLVTDVVRQLASGKGFVFSDYGQVSLRGFEDPVHLYSLAWRPA